MPGSEPRNVHICVTRLVSLRIRSGFRRTEKTRSSSSTSTHRPFSPASGSTACSRSCLAGSVRTSSVSDSWNRRLDQKAGTAAFQVTLTWAVPPVREDPLRGRHTPTRDRHAAEVQQVRGMAHRAPRRWQRWRSRTREGDAVLALSRPAVLRRSARIGGEDAPQAAKGLTTSAGADDDLPIGNGEVVAIQLAVLYWAGLDNPNGTATLETGS